MCTCEEKVKAAVQILPAVIKSGVSLALDVVAGQTSTREALRVMRDAPEKLGAIIESGGELNPPDEMQRRLANCNKCVWGKGAVRCRLCRCPKIDLAKFAATKYPECITCWNSDYGIKD